MVDAMPGTTQAGGDICERQRAEIAGQVVSGILSIQEACAQHQLSPEVLLEWVAAFRQSSLTAFDEQVRRTLADQGVDVSSLTTAEFQADLGEFTIADLIQTLTLGDRDGVITVSHDGRESQIWCAGGELVDAESGKLTGSAAVHRMVALEQGRVRASFRRIQRERRVHASTMELLLEGARRGDECRVLRNQLGAGPYRRSPRTPSEVVRPGPAAAGVLRHFESPCNLSEALAESELGDLETLTLISELVEQGWLESSADAGSPRQSGLSNPPLVLSLARFPTQPATPRAYRRWALGLGAAALLLAALPLYLAAPRAAQTSSAAHAAAPPGEPAATASARFAQSAPAEQRPALVSGQERPAALPELPIAPEGDAEAALGRAETEAVPAPRAISRSRRRAARAGGVAVPPPAPAVAAAAVSAAGANAAPRIQVIEPRRPKMQIVE